MRMVLLHAHGCMRACARQCVRACMSACAHHACVRACTPLYSSNDCSSFSEFCRSHVFSRLSCAICACVCVGGCLRVCARGHACVRACLRACVRACLRSLAPAAQQTHAGAAPRARLAHSRSRLHVYACVRAFGRERPIVCVRVCVPGPMWREPDVSSLRGAAQVSTHAHTCAHMYGRAHACTQAHTCVPPSMNSSVATGLTRQ